METLPPELFCNILPHLGALDFLSFRRTCRRHMAIVDKIELTSKPTVWRRFVFQDFSEACIEASCPLMEVLPKDDPVQWKVLYTKLFKGASFGTRTLDIHSRTCMDIKENIEKIWFCCDNLYIEHSSTGKYSILKSADLRAGPVQQHYPKTQLLSGKPEGCQEYFCPSLCQRYTKGLCEHSVTAKIQSDDKKPSMPIMPLLSTISWSWKNYAVIFKKENKDHCWFQFWQIDPPFIKNLGTWPQEKPSSDVENLYEEFRDNYHDIDLWTDNITPETASMLAPFIEVPYFKQMRKKFKVFGDLHIMISKKTELGNVLNVVRRERQSESIGLELRHVVSYPKRGEESKESSIVDFDVCGTSLVAVSANGHVVWASLQELSQDQLPKCNRESDPESQFYLRQICSVKLRGRIRKIRASLGEKTGTLTVALVETILDDFSYTRDVLHIVSIR